MPKLRRARRRFPLPVLIGVLAVAVIVAAFAAVQLAAALHSYTSAGQEYEALRLEPAPALPAAVLPTATLTEQPEAADERGKALAEINPDYIGWLRIEGTEIDYPIARGADNDKYLTTTFEGNENKLGAIFMDYRCTDGFDGRHTVIYGHNARDDSMFGCLARYADSAYREQHPDIQITTADGETRTYRIFSVRETDITDPAYRLEFDSPADFAEYAAMLDAPEGAESILTLSTCTNGGSKDNRLLVQAALQ